jgi:hypothetical protein
MLHAGNEQERKVIELLKLGKTTRQIAKEERMSLTPIIAIRKKLFGEDSRERNNFSRALALFSRGRKLTEVTIKLGLSAEVAEKYYRDFWRLERLHELCRIYNKNKSRLRLFMYFCKQLEKRKLTSRKDFDEVLKIIDTNNALGEEIHDFDTNFLSKVVKGKAPITTDKEIFWPNDEGALPDPHIYGADELEQSFTNIEV